MRFGSIPSPAPSTPQHVVLFEQTGVSQISQGGLSGAAILPLGAAFESVSILVSHGTATSGLFLEVEWLDSSGTNAVATPELWTFPDDPGVPGYAEVCIPVKGPTLVVNAHNLDTANNGAIFVVGHASRLPAVARQVHSVYGETGPGLIVQETIPAIGANAQAAAQGLPLWSGRCQIAASLAPNAATSSPLGVLNLSTASGLVLPQLVIPASTHVVGGDYCYMTADVVLPREPVTATVAMGAVGISGGHISYTFHGSEDT